MNFKINGRTMSIVRTLFLLCAGFAAVALAQSPGGALRGTLTDDSGAVIPGATIKISGNGVEKSVTTGADGSYTVTGLTSGNYTVRVSFPGFTPVEVKTAVVGGRAQELPIQLKVSLERQEVTVQADAVPTVSTEPENNAGSLVLRQQDLEALPDDPDDLAADLQALAGPAAGPNGGQIFIDGFSGGRLPPKESIREIRINQNPFSAEYDRLGFGRIEILTKPGSDKFHGSAFLMNSDSYFNSRNPFAANKADFRSTMFGGNVSGPLGKRASFFLDVEKRNIDDNAIINATTLDDALFPTPYSLAVVTPQRRTTINPRIDYQLSTNHTLVGRYTYSRSDSENAGIGTFSLLSRAYDSRDRYHNIQITETAVLNARTINETRIQYLRSRTADTGDNSIAAINVQQAFNGGGAQIGNSSNRSTHFGLQNYTSNTLGRHTMRYGLRLRRTTLSDYSPQNFGGTFTFAGGVLAPVLDAANQPVLDPSGQAVVERISSIEQYRRTLLFQRQGLPADQIRALGGGASQFSLSAGNPLADIAQTDVGLFYQDDWRLRPNFTLSLGLRYETQTNIHDWRDIAPRVGFAWSPGATGQNAGRGKTVIRGGFGMFYDRIAQTLSLQAERFNGVNQLQYIVQNPSFFPNVPSTAELNAQRIPLAIRQVDSRIRAPYTAQAAIGIERQLPKNTTIASTFTYSRAVRLLLNRNINAPLPGTYDPAIPGSGVRPYGDIGNLFLYESSGQMDQKQWITNVNSRLTRGISIFSYYTLGYANSNTDGSSSSPANPYNLAAEWGRAAIDTRHRFMLGGSIAVPWDLRLSPFVIARSGNPFDITVGRDTNGDTLFDERPSFATDLTGGNVVQTAYGAFNTTPAVGAVMIPRNYGDGPGSFSVNMRVSRTFGFGPSRGGSAGASSSGGGERGGGRSRGGSGGGGGMRMGGGGGMRGMFDGPSSDHRYNLTISVSARNLFNRVNPGQPIGNLSSPLFGVSNSLGGGYGPFGATANNRRIDFQARFSF
jgi:hypothetical protein